MMETKGQNRILHIALFVIALAVGWNFWLPTAENFYNLVTKANENRTKDLQNVDFYAYYNAGSRFSKGVNPYYWQISSTEKQFSDFLYPPTLLPLYSQLARIEYGQARLLWLALYFLCYLAAVAALCAVLKKEIRILFLGIALLLTVCSFPFLDHIHNGQADVFIASFTILGLAAYVRGWKIVAAALFALGTVMKVSPVLFLIFFVIFMRDWRFLIAYAIAGIIFVLASLPFVPLSLYPDYIFNVLPEVSKGTSYWINQSLLKYLSINSVLAQLVSIAGLLGFAVLAWYIRRRVIVQSPHSVDLRYPMDSGSFLGVSVFLMNLLVILIFAGKSWSMAYVWTILPAALLLALLFRMEASPVYMILVGVGIFLLESKVYGYPLLDSLNLWGSLFLMGVLIYGIFNSYYRLKPTPEEP